MCKAVLLTCELCLCIRIHSNIALLGRSQTLPALELTVGATATRHNVVNDVHVGSGSSYLTCTQVVKLNLLQSVAQTLMIDHLKALMTTKDTTLKQAAQLADGALLACE